MRAATDDRRRPVRARVLAASWAIALLLSVAGATSFGAIAAGAAEPASGTAPVPTTAAPAGDVTTSTIASGIGDLEGGSNTPSPRGEPAPPRSQRLADSVIAVVLLVVLVGGVTLAVWTARRRPRRPASDAVGGSQRER